MLYPQVGDHQSLVASLRQSSYYPLFKDEVSVWEGKLALLQVREGGQGGEGSGGEGAGRLESNTCNLYLAQMFVGR